MRPHTTGEAGSETTSDKPAVQMCGAPDESDEGAFAPFSQDAPAAGSIVVDSFGALREGGKYSSRQCSSIECKNPSESLRIADKEQEGPRQSQETQSGPGKPHKQRARSLRKPLSHLITEEIGAQASNPSEQRPAQGRAEHQRRADDLGKETRREERDGDIDDPEEANFQVGLP